uniref:nucleotidyltransferase n=1 Tax=Persicitalea sp. TaxID=3100273 RepID=UPI003593E2CC
KDDVEATFAPRLRGKIDYDFAIQGIQSYVPEELGEVTRAKPWGTGHATLCAWPQTGEPFAVINADDFYGRESFATMAEFLSTDTDDQQHAMIGYELKRTLSENGTVSRGVCIVKADGNLSSVTERTKIFPDKVGNVYFEEDDILTEIPPYTPVSMNFWGFKPSAFPLMEAQFQEFARENADNPKAEFYIPLIVTNLIYHNQGNCRVFTSKSDWFGVTYPEDKPTVQAALQVLHDAGHYPATLWEA